MFGPNEQASSKAFYKSGNFSCSRAFGPSFSHMPSVQMEPSHMPSVQMEPSFDPNRKTVFAFKASILC
jgi:hypothetical protein